MIDFTMLEPAFTVFIIVLLAVMLVCIVVGVMDAFLEHDKQKRRQEKRRARQRQKKVIDILSPSQASRRMLHPQVSEAFKHGQQAAEDELMAAWADIVNIVDDKERDE